MTHAARRGLGIIGCLLLAIPAALAAPRTDLHGDPLPEGAIARLGTVRFRQADNIILFEYLDARHLLTIGQNGIAHVWDVPSGREVRRFGADQKRDNVYYAVSVLLSPDRQLLVWGYGRDRVLRAWDVATGQERWQLPTDPKATPFRPLAFAGDGQSLLIEGGVGTAWAIYDAASGKLKTQLEVAPKNVRSFYPILNTDGSLLAARGQDGTIRLWDTSSGKVIRQLGEATDPKQGIYSLNRIVFSPEGKTLIAQRMTRDQAQPARYTGSVNVYDVATGKEVRQIPGPKEGVKGEFAIAPDGRTLAWHDAENTIRLYDLASGQEVRRLGEPIQDPSNTFRIHFSPDSKSLLIRGRLGGVRPVVRLHDVASGKQLWERETETLQAIFSPDSRQLAISATTARAVQLWDAQTGRELPGLPGHLVEILSLAVAPDGQTVVTHGQDTLRRWDAATGKELVQLKGPGGAYFYMTALSSDGRTAAFGVRGDGGLPSVQVWDVAANRRRSTVELPRPGFQALTLSPDGALLAVRSSDLSLLLYDTASGKQRLVLNEQIGAINSPDGRRQVQPLGGTGRLLFLPDGTTLASIWMATAIDPQGRPSRQIIVHLADLRTGKSLRRFTVGEGEIFSDLCTLSADGRCLAFLVRTTGAKVVFGVYLVEIASGKVRARIPIEGASALALSPDGTMMALNGRDGAIRLCRVAGGGEVGQLTDPQNTVRALAFTPDGRRLVSSAGDTAALVWDVSALTARPDPAGRTLDAGAFDGLWTTLANGDADKSFQAMLQLWAAPADAISSLRTRLKPVTAADPARLARLVADLESDEFPVRQKAEDELGKLGELAAAALYKALANQPPLDLRQRLERLRERLTAGLLSPEELRGIRAVEILERIGAPEARQVLETLAQGAPEVRLTRDARAALERLKR